VTGPKKAGDFRTDAILGAYEKLISLAYPQALLATFSTYSRYSGPREAVFTALCRKNFGCTHFVLGRDHTGVGNFYAPNENFDLFESIGDLGITPVFFDTVYYSQKQKKTVESSKPDEADFKSISGTMIRDLLDDGKPVPDWCMRNEISEWLLEKQSGGDALFIKDN